MMMQIAEVVARRSTCERGVQVGAVVCDETFLRVLAIGYNGQPQGQPHFCDGDKPGGCGCIHAEVNALIKAPFGEGTHLFSTLSPCLDCARVICNSGVKFVWYREAHRSFTATLQLLRDANISLVHLNPDPVTGKCNSLIVTGASAWDKITRWLHV